MRHKLDWAAFAAAPSRLLQRASVIMGTLVLCVGAVQADYLNTNGAESAPNFAEIRVFEDRVRVLLEIDLKDYAAFLPTSVADAAVSLNPSLLAENPMSALVVKIGETALEPTVETVELRLRKDRPMPIRTAGMPEPPKPAPQTSEVIYAELEYPFAGRPERISFAPPNNDNGTTLVTMGFLSWHGETAINDYRYLSSTETLALDWDDPWYTAFENRVIARHGSAPITSFISVEPKEVRHEVVFRLRDLEAWTELSLGNAQSLTATELASIKEAAAQVLANRNPLVVDGVRRHPASIRVEQVELNLQGLKVLDAQQFTERNTAMFGAVLSFPHVDLPEELSLTWELFSERGSPVPIRVTDLAGGVPETVTSTDPTVVWTNFLTSWSTPETKPIIAPLGREFDVPVVSFILLAIACVIALFAFKSQSWRRYALTAPSSILLILSFLSSGATHSMRLPWAGTPNSDQATQILDGLLQNVSVSMLSADAATFQSSLGSYVSKEHRLDVGAEMRRGLSIELPSGALARIEAVDDITADSVQEAKEGLQILARWDAYVSGGHWGHLHRRVISYRALLDVAEHDTGWRMTGLTVLEAKPRASSAAEGGNT
ncbi:hypothetical protein [Ruegeria sp. 6PALISEP08]|uniref:hypothetical protein n=1 Tax=Ruegeria sp. 6PALISEP08 TaxID=1225660 RepID=UPI00067ED487|nr:hypothetical protein [Ruegeria sp. 6PALISEP08]